MVFFTIVSTTEWWDLPVFCLVDTGFIVAGELTRLDRKLVHSTSAVRGFLQDLLIVNQHVYIWAEIEPEQTKA